MVSAEHLVAIMPSRRTAVQTRARNPTRLAGRTGHSKRASCVSLVQTWHGVRRRGPILPSSAIELTNLRFGWRPTEPVLLDVPELRLDAGERVLLYGPSGCGKSTLLSLIAGVLQPTAGSVRLLGNEISAMPNARRDAFRGANLGFIFQMFNLVPYLSVRDNVLLPARFSAARANRMGDPAREASRLLAALGLSATDLLRTPATRLSVGQQQRVAAARALLGRPPILIADEPTSALDPESQQAFVNLLIEECSADGTTMLFVSHDRSLADRFDRNVDLDEINRVAAKRPSS